MTDARPPVASLPPSDLERALIDLGRSIDYPDTPDLAASIAVRLRSEKASPPRTSLLARLPARRVGWLLAAALLVAIVSGLVLFPEVRTTIADRLGLGGIEIRWTEEAPTPQPSPVGARLMLGKSTTLEEARAAIPFPILVPTREGFSDPPEVYLLGLGDDAMISFVYPAGPTLPATADGPDGVGALLTQFAGSADRNLIEKGLHAGGEESRTTIESVKVGLAWGFWISGAPHTFFLVCHDDGDCREERYRLAGNVLLWEQNGVTLRLESALAREEALAIAESVIVSG
jgi:hypothetical protein